VTEVYEQSVAAGAAGNESVGTLDALTKFTKLYESGVVERLNLGEGVKNSADGRDVRASAPLCRTQWTQREARADAFQ
jgi:hypothetical protein